ncbi:MAG: FeoB-associated Cys-rich membrane protein [Spirochaetales bacterium]|nr:FeoB-associated Cys-rich membrane protein [Spirochaetales bacterium]
MNAGTILVLSIVVIISFLAAWNMYKDKKKGKSCSSCPSSSFCSGHCSSERMVENILKEAKKRK